MAQGIRKGIDKGVLAANVVVEPTCHIDVLGKSADAVAAEIVKKLGTAPEQGCVLTLQGLSGTGKGTTVEKLKASLPKPKPNPIPNPDPNPNPNPYPYPYPKPKPKPEPNPNPSPHPNQASLPKAVTWSNGNVFRSITLLAVTSSSSSSGSTSTY